jgi:pyruvate/2-oxoglutarate dehydrogenase complex dihydrolipoamide acyltransferase (E2) component
MFPRVTGFVKTIAVDRGSRVRAGAVLATLDAPELSAQRAEAQSKVQGANAQLAAARAKADADTSTYDKLNAASATPGAVAGNDLVSAQKAAEAGRSQVAAAEQNVEAERQSLRSVSDMESYLKWSRPLTASSPNGISIRRARRAGGAPVRRPCSLMTPIGFGSWCPCPKRTSRTSGPARR